MTNQASYKNNLIEQLGEDFLRKTQAGDSPSIDQYTENYPEWADEIREFIEAFMLVHKLAPNSLEFKNIDLQARNPDSQLPTIEGYRIDGELGRGGMGVVYVARHISLDREVALKVLPGGWAEDAKSVERFLREAKSAGALHHSNIVPVFDVGSSEDTHYYAMQLIEGAPLNDVIEQVKQMRDCSSSQQQKQTSSEFDESFLIARTVATGILDEKESFHDEPAQLTMQVSSAVADMMTGDQPKKTRVHKVPGNNGSLSDTTPLAMATSETTKISKDSPSNYYKGVAKVGRQVADALKYAHSKGIIHRDIKPANLLLDLLGNVWVTDFGLAKTQEDGLTETGNLVGTLRYMSPERFRGQHDASCDIYALGVTLYEMLALQPVFDTSDRMNLIMRIHESEPIALGRVDRNIPLDLQTIVHKAMEKDPSKRFANAGLLSEELQRFLSGQPILARKVSVGERVLRWAVKNKTVASLLMLISLGLVGGIIASTIGTLAYQKVASDAQANLVQANINAEKALRSANEAKQKTIEAQQKADEAFSINEFLNSDILGAANLMEGNFDRNVTLVSVLNSASRKVSNRFDERPIIAGQLHRTIGEAYLSLGEFTSAKFHLETSHQLLAKNLDPDHPDTLDSLFQLGRLLLESRGDAKIAKANFEKVRTDRLERLGEAAPATLEASYELARLYLKAGKPNEGYVLMVTTYETSKSSLGESHRDTIKALVRIGEFHLDRKEILAARPLVLQALELCENELGEEDMLTLTARINMAELELVSKNIEIAKKLLLKNRESSELWLGENHPQTLRILARIAAMYEDLGRKEDCLALHQEIIDRNTITYGENNARVLKEKVSFAKVLSRFEGREQHAIDLLKEVRAQWVLKESGEKNNNVALIDLELGMAYLAQGKIESARASMELAKDVLTLKNEAVRKVLLNLYLGENDFANGRLIMIEETVARTKKYGETSMTVAKMHQNVSYVDLQLNRIATEEGRLDAAKQHLKSAESRLRKSLSIIKANKHQGQIQLEELHNCTIKLALCMALQGRNADCLETLQPAIDFNGWSDLKAWKHARALGIRGEALTNLGQLKLAEKSLLNAQKGFDQHLTRRSDRISYNKKMAERFVHLYKKMERPEDALIWQNKLDQIYKDEAARKAK